MVSIIIFRSFIVCLHRRCHVKRRCKQIVFLYNSFQLNPAIVGKNCFMVNARKLTESSRIYGWGYYVKYP